MKQLLTFLCALLFALAGKAAPAGDELKQLLAEARAIVNTAGNAADREVSRALSEARRAVNATDRQIDRAMAEARRVVGASDREIDRAIAEARAAIDAAETAAVANQSIEELNKAAREQVVRELGLTSRQRKEFEPLYKAYREALDKAVNTPDAGTDEAAQRQGLKTKLSNIAATAQVKRDYVDKFAAVLTAEQIRRLYNTEGEIGTNIKRAAVDRRRNQNTRLKGSGRMVTQDWGKAGDYTGISAAAFFDVTVSPTARTISVTADDNVIDYLVLERDGGTLKFRVNANNTENISVSVVVPASAALRQISAGSYGKVTCKLPLERILRNTAARPAPAARTRRLYLAAGVSVAAALLATGILLSGHLSHRAEAPLPDIEQMLATTPTETLQQAAAENYDDILYNQQL